jgi:exopolysaccharide biosynthesis polyprenyl glycosylphosphotransferase
VTSIPVVHDRVDAGPLALLDRRRQTHRFKRRGWLVRRALLAADVVGLLAAFLLTETLLGSGPNIAGELNRTRELLFFLGALPFWVLAAKIYGLYNKDEERTNHSTADDVAGVFQLMTITVWLLRSAAYVVHLGRPDFAKLFLFWILATTFVSVARAGGRSFCRRRVEYVQNTIIVGAGDVGRGLAERILRHPEYGLNLVGFVDAAENAESQLHARVPVLGDVDSLPELVSLLDVERVIVGSEGHAETLSFIRALNDAGVQVDIVPRFFEVISSDIDIHMVEGMPVIGVPAFGLSRSSAFLKRWVDIVGATVGLAICAPLLVAVAVAIKLDSPGPVFFRQERMGARDKPFRMLKFRSMVFDADDQKAGLAHLNKHRNGNGQMFKIENDPRLTRVGRVLRRVSIDELPQFLNVLRGEMSLVGPRPLILEEHAHVRDWETRRLGLRPGMTGLWQVLGRDDIPFSEMVRLDYVYVTSWTLGGDIRLLLRTLPIVARGV